MIIRRLEVITDHGGSVGSRFCNNHSLFVLNLNRELRITSHAPGPPFSHNPNTKVTTFMCVSFIDTLGVKCVYHKFNRINIFLKKESVLTISCARYPTIGEHSLARE